MMGHNHFLHITLATLTSLLLLSGCETKRGYLEEEVVFRNELDGAILSGTLTKPVGKEVFPAAILISGGGLQDRDETVYGHKPFKVLAEFLSNHGIGVLRFDDRGAGGSKGDVWNATIEFLASDAYAGIQHLKIRPDIDTNHIGIIGHSLGAMQGTILTRKYDDISFLVMLGGIGIPWSENSIKSDRLVNTMKGSNSEVIEAGTRLLESLYGTIGEFPDNANYSASRKRLIQIIDAWQSSLKGEAKKEIEEFTTSNPDFWIKNMAEEYATPLFISCVKFKPYYYLSKTECPVLSIIGEKDIQVLPENNNAIKKALEAGGNRNYKILTPGNINHLMQKCETGLISEYEEIDEDFNREVMIMILDWLTKLNVPI